MAIGRLAGAAVTGDSLETVSSIAITAVGWAVSKRKQLPKRDVLERGG
jgi:hypothetical protein